MNSLQGELYDYYDIIIQPCLLIVPLLLSYYILLWRYFVSHSSWWWHWYRCLRGSSPVTRGRIKLGFHSQCKLKRKHKRAHKLNMLNENEHQQAQAQQEGKIQILVFVLMIVSRPFSREKWVAVLVFVASENQAWVLLKSDISFRIALAAKWLVITPLK